MRAGPDQLTEKERQALRLLLAGHDAKSSAVELGVSVHTINDRLRNARRKLNVSSSREAARILGDAEEGTPQSPAHKSLGMAGQHRSAETAGLTTTGRTGPVRAVWLAGGMLMMSLIIAFGVVAFGNQEGAPSTEPVSPVSEVNEDAESMPRVRAFLAALDAGDWEGSWDAAGPFVQGQLSRAQWAASLEAARKPLGGVGMRELISVDRTGNLPDAPAGDYEVLQFRTGFVRRANPAVERVVMVRGDAGWEVAGYYII